MKSLNNNIPDLIGLTVDEASEVLKQNKIRNEIVTYKKYSLKKKNTIIKTKPKFNNPIGKDDKLELYISRGFFVLLLPVLITLLISGATVSNIMFNYVTKPELIDKPHTDELNYADSTLISISKNSKSRYGIDYYEYCITDTNKTNNCEWDRTDTKNLYVNRNGHSYVFVRGVDKHGNKSKPAKIETYIDNINPVIDSIKVVDLNTTSFTVKVVANDDTSIKYYYSLDNKEYVEDNDTHLFDNLKPNTKYDVFVKIIDNAGNEIVVKTEVNTPKDDTKDKKGHDSGNDDNNSNNNSSNDVNDELSIEENVWDIPKISLEDVPVSIVYGDSYALPSYVDFGNDTGVYSCTVENKKYNNTELIPIGKHTITCVAESKHGKSVMINKDINVDIKITEDEILDGWILYNLYYPEESYNWQWRLDGINGIRTGYDNSDWQDYTGPILVRVEDVENIYIRYDIDGETYIITPKGKTTVDIEPDKWTIEDGENTKVKIVYDKNASVKEYRINGGAWMTYDGEFTVEPNTLIDARVSKKQEIYNNLGELVTTKTLNNYDSAYISMWVVSSNTDSPNNSSNPDIANTPKPSEAPKPGNPTPSIGNPVPPAYPRDIILEGPSITSDPTNNGVDETTVTITSEYSGTIYYSIDNGVYTTYTDSFAVTKNCNISAYVITDDGLQTATSYYRVSNIKELDLPWVGITASPADYLDGNQKKVTVSINASDYDDNTLEYSFNNVIFQKYTEPFEVAQSTTVYARAKNSKGYGYDSLAINTVIPPVKKDNFDISIFGNPSNEVEGLVNKVTVTISYDNKSTIKKYSLDGKNWKDYNGPFEIDENTTVHAFAEATNAEGYTWKSFDYLTTGIAQPTFAINTKSLSYTVKVDINYDRTASKKLYRIDSGEWQDYTTPIRVEENCTIEAYNENELGYSAVNSTTITNIIPKPQYTTLDKGQYYLIKPNYPSTSNEDSREYRWKDNVWKEYNGIGIVLIKPEYNGKLNLKDGIVITDNGKDYIFTDHYYQLEKPLIEEINNLYIRWNNTKPDSPEIILENDSPVFEDTVTISYDRRLKTKLYKIVYSNGEQTDWLPYTGPIKIDKNNTVIYAKGLTVNQVESNIAEKLIANIDEVPPVLYIEGNTSIIKRSIQLMVKAEDNLGIKELRYIKGSKNEDGYKDAESINNYSLVTINENGTYTFYAEDEAGNIVYKQIEINCIDTDAPNVVISVLTTTIGPSVDINIEYGDAAVKKYSIGNNNNYKDYTGVITINSIDVADLANEDGTITIYAKGVDAAGNETEISEKIYTLDLDIFAKPQILNGNKYGLITSKGIKNMNYYSVMFDTTRDDLINEIKIGDEDYKIYTGVEYESDVTIYARSTKKTTGLTREVSEYVTTPSDGLKVSAYDKKADTYDTVASNSYKRINVDNDGSYKEILVRSSSEGEAKAELYGPTGDLIDEIKLSSTDTSITLPSGITKIHFVSGNKELKIYEIEFTQTYKTINGDSILDIVNKKLDSGKYLFKVKNEIYPVHLYVLNGNHVITKDTQYGDAGDVGNGSSYAKNMVIVKVNGDYTVNEGVTVGPYYTQYGGPKGFLLYVTGKLTNNGTIDNSHGAYAKGQDVYLWKNADGTYEYVPATGGVGGAAGWSTGPGRPGTSGTGRQTGGGGTGNSDSYKEYQGPVGAGGTGTSYSGGPGGGGHRRLSSTTDGSNEGGAGGLCVGGACPENNQGAGNPTTGTGGLLIIYANEFENNNSIKATGSLANDANGASGGGSINIFTNQSTNINKLGIIVDTRYKEILGEATASGGINNNRANEYGGAGTVSIGEIRNGKYYDLKDIISQDMQEYENSVLKKGDSILSILNHNSDLTTGYYSFKVKDEIYPVHLYVLNGNQIITENVQYGDDGDVGDESKYAQNMVIVKVNGDYTVNKDITVGPYYTQYGGPKGFLLYVTGKLTNNGTIDNSHGAYAKGQDVYLWKNTDGTYEYVPAIGGTGGTAGWSTGPGRPGTSGTGRQTGGGGTGNSDSYREYQGPVGAGGTGTSYSGGPGGGGHRRLSSTTDGSNEGGAGGLCVGGECPQNNQGAGNPTTGTGGLLIIYANEFENNNSIKATGSLANDANGASGGGSINVFYSNGTTLGEPDAKGADGNGKGGNGTVTFTQIDNTNTIVEEVLSTQQNVIGKIKSLLPVIMLNNDSSEYSFNIDYKADGINQYSLDYGNTWIDYVDDIRLSENSTVIARTIDVNGNVISASSFTVTKFIKEKSSDLIEERVEETTTTNIIKE